MIEEIHVQYKPSIFCWVLTYPTRPNGYCYSGAKNVEPFALDQCKPITDNYEEKLKTLTHADKERFIEHIIKRWDKDMPKLGVAFWVRNKILVINAEEDCDTFESSGQDAIEENKRLREENSSLKEGLQKLRETHSSFTIKYDALEKECQMLQKKNGCEFKYKDEDNNRVTINLNLRETVVIKFAIFSQAMKSKEDISTNMKRLIGNYETVKKYLQVLKTDGDCPLSPDEKEHIRLVCRIEHIDTGSILDYIND